MLKNNKGITLISVVITVIMMITILSSIIYSNNNSNELKEEMLLNSDIEQLNKKVQLYYLKNKTLPISDGEPIEDLDGDLGLNFYKLNISLLENLNLKNLEKDNQYYVINKETHLICFVIGEEIQKGKYYENYKNIIDNISNEIEFNYIKNIDGSSGNNSIIGSNKYFEIAEDFGNSGGTTSISPEKPYANYIGWNYRGNKTNSDFVLQYDSEYNVVDDSGNPTFSKNATIWADLTNNGNNGKLVNGNGYLEYDFRVQSNDNIVERFWDEGTRQIATENYSWEENGRTYS